MGRCGVPFFCIKLAIYVGRLSADSVEKLFLGGAEKIPGLYGACVGHEYGGLRKLLSSLTKITHTNLCMPIEQDSRSVWFLGEIRSIGNLSFSTESAINSQSR
jgi:hypothetical protein